MQFSTCDFVHFYTSLNLYLKWGFLFLVVLRMLIKWRYLGLVVPVIEYFNIPKYEQTLLYVEYILYLNVYFSLLLRATAAQKMTSPTPLHLNGVCSFASQPMICLHGRFVSNLWMRLLKCTQRPKESTAWKCAGKGKFSATLKPVR